MAQCNRGVKVTVHQAEKRDTERCLRKSKFVDINFHLQAEYPQEGLRKRGVIFCLHFCVHLELSNPEQGSFILPLYSNDINMYFSKRYQNVLLVRRNELVSSFCLNKICFIAELHFFFFELIFNLIQ